MRNLVLAYYKLFAILDDSITELFKKLFANRVTTVAIIAFFSVEFLIVFVVAWLVKAARLQMKTDIKSLGLIK